MKSKKVSSVFPDVKDRYIITDTGLLYTGYGAKLMANSINNKGYVLNYLSTLDPKITRKFTRHRLVMLCFNPIEGCEHLQVNHIDGNKLNNDLSNLEWCTNQENRIHAVKMGLAAHMIGETNPYHKLTEQEVLEMIQDLRNHVPYSKLMEKYDCSKSTISAIKNKRNWRYLTENIEFS